MGEALVEVVLGMPRLRMFFALGLGGGADEGLHADLALRSDGIIKRLVHLDIHLANGRHQPLCSAVNA